MSITLVAVLFFVIAVMYSAVGFGGGSSYIAILLIAGLAIPDIRMTALLCNIIVVGGSSFHFIKARLIPWRSALPIILLSVPFAFIGGTILLDQSIYKILASILLITASGLMFIKKDLREEKRELSPFQLAGIGGGIGLFSGAIGIGGGIFLAPILHLIRWQSAKVISATASLFILFNSIAGIAGQLTNRPSVNWGTLSVLGLAVLIGGQLGNYLNLNILNESKVRLFTAILVGVIGLRILFSAL